MTAPNPDGEPQPVAQPPRPPASSSVSHALAVGLLAVVIVTMLHRLRLAVDFTDEAFSTALPYRFAQGDRPFIDEINSAQTAGMIVTPFVWLFLKIKGSSTGLIWFVRCLYLVFKLGVAAGVFRTARRFMNWPLALASSLFCVVFVSHSIPNLGYNTLGACFFALGSFIAVRRFGANGTYNDLIGAGVCHGLASTAYPPMMFPTFVCGAMIYLVAARKERRQAFGYYVGGGGLVVAVVVPILIHAGWKNLHAMIQYGLFLNPRANQKAFEIILDWYAHSPVSFWMIPSLAIVIVALKREPRWSLWVLPLFTLCLALYSPLNLGSQLSMVIYLAFFAPLFLVVLWDSQIARSLFFIVWIPSVFAGLVTAFSSTNGELNGAIGLFTAASLFLVYQGMAAEKLFREANIEKHLEPVLLLGPIILVLSMLIRFNFTVYRDAATSELKVPVESGPFKGLRTTRDRVKWLADFEAAMKRHERPNGKLIVYWEFPAGYLFSNMRAGENSVWLVGAADQIQQIEFHKARLTGQNLSVKIKTYPGGPNGGGPSALEKWLEKVEHPIESTPSWEISGE